FAAMGFPLVAGRDFTASDRESSTLVAIVSRKLAEEEWPGKSALGKRIRLGGESPYDTIDGVVGDFRSRGYDDAPEPTTYLPCAQASKGGYSARGEVAVVIKAAGDPVLLVRAPRAAVRALDATARVSQTRTLEDGGGGAVANRRFSTMLLAG